VQSIPHPLPCTLIFPHQDQFGILIHFGNANQDQRNDCDGDSKTHQGQVIRACSAITSGFCFNTSKASTNASRVA
jgi:hypothetical protein